MTRRPSLFPLFIRQAAVICIVLLMVHCTSVSPEERLRATIATGIEAAERGDHAGLADFVSEEYSDDRGRDRRELLNLVRGYRIQLGPLHIFYVERSLIVASPTWESRAPTWAGSNWPSWNREGTGDWSRPGGDRST